MASATIQRRMGLTGDKGIKVPVRAATTGNITLYGEQTVGGVALVSGDRCLVWQQIDTTQNGIWDVSTAAWTRSLDANGSQDWSTGTIGLITMGTYQDQFWINTTAGTVAPGSASMSFLVGIPSLPILAEASGSSLIGFIQSGVGAVFRLVRDKLRETVSVKDYGAVGDGVADDTGAMNAAAAAASVLKKALFVPSGVYKMTSPWAIPIKVRVIGESPSIQHIADPGATWNYGAIIFKAHNGDAVTKTGAGPYDEGAPIENISVCSDRAAYPAGNGFVFDKVSGCHLDRCNVFSVGGDSFVLGVTAGDVTGHNYLYNCYSNNPVGVNFRARQKWGRYRDCVSDGGTIGIFFNNAPQSQLDGFHFEGFTQVGVKISNGSTNVVASGRGYLGNTTADVVIGVQVTNEAGNSGAILENVFFAGNAIPGSQAIQLFGAAIDPKITRCNFNNWDIGAAVSAPGTSLGGSVFYQCTTPIYSGAEDTTYTGNKFDSTVGANTINHVSGTRGLWENNVMDKPPLAGVTGVPGNFSGIKVRGNPGYVTRKSGTTGAIAAYTTWAHGLAGVPAPDIVLTCYSSGVTSFPQLTTLDATNIALYWTGGGNAQWNWQARCPCDY